MTDDLETAPLPDPVPQPSRAEPDPIPEPAQAFTPAATPATTPAAVPTQTSSSKRNRMLGLGAQGAGVIGIVLFVVLAAVVLLGRGWATSTVDDISGSIDAKMAQAVPLIDTASAKVSEISGRVGALTDAADALAAKVDAGSGLLGALRDQFTSLQARYQDFRTSYSGVRDTALSALDRLETLDRLIPGFTLPPGPVDALKDLDARIQELDTRITDVGAAITDGPAQKVAAVVAEKTAKVQEGLATASGVLSNAQTRLTELREEVISTGNAINTWLTVLSFLLFLLFLYFAFLHWVLFGVGRRLRREASDS